MDECKNIHKLIDIKYKTIRFSWEAIARRKKQNKWLMLLCWEKNIIIIRRTKLRI